MNAALFCIHACVFYIHLMYIYDIHINMLQVIYKRKMEMERAVGGERKKHLISQLIFRFKLPGPLVAYSDSFPFPRHHLSRKRAGQADTP